MPSATKTQPELKLDWHELIETALTMPGSVGDTYNRFYTYSWMNQVLLMMQGVREPVATYSRWQQLGRQVVRGSKAKAIVRPIFFEKENDEGEIERVTRFKPDRCLFGLSETEGDELPPVQLPGWDFDTALERLNVRRVRFESLDGNTQGYSTDRDLAINPLAVYPAKTRMHELAHIVSGHTTEAKLGEYATHRGLMEFEAEGSAFLVMNELGSLEPDDASESRAYIQSWMRDQRPPESSIRTVFKTTDAILKAGRLAVEAEL